MSLFLNYPGIRGEAADPAGWLDIDELVFGTGRRITSHASTQHDRESANAAVTDLTISRCMDSASPHLFIASCCGAGVEAVLRATKTGAGNGGETFLEYVLHHALICSYEVEAVAQGGARPIETLVLSFTGIELRYTTYDEDGRALAPVSVGFDFGRNIRA